MRQFAAFGFALIVGFVLCVGFAQATGDDGSPDDPAAVSTGVRYEWHGAIGELNIVADPGQDFEVYDASGAPVAGGFLAEPFAAVIAPNCGFGPDGAILRVRLGADEFVVVDDPDWEWH